jgi:hypothetical protein
MKISQKYSHLNGEEYLIVHHNNLYKEIMQVVNSINATEYLTKVSQEKTMPGAMLFSPIELNKAFNNEFKALGWSESR